MRTTLRLLAGAIAGSLIAAAPAVAQTVTPPQGNTTFQVTPYGGYMWFGDMLSGPVGTSLSNQNGWIYGAQAGIRLTPNFSIIGNAAHGSSNLDANAPFIGGTAVGSTSVTFFDAGLELSAPLSSGAASGLALSPFADVTIGGVHYGLSSLTVLNTSTTNFAYGLGGGVDVGLGSNVAVRLMAKDYISKFSYDNSGFSVQGNTTNHIALTAGLRLSF